MSFGILPTDDLSAGSVTHTVSGTLDTAPSLQGGVAINNGQLGVVTVDTANTTHALSNTVDGATAQPLDTSNLNVGDLTGTVTNALPVSAQLPAVDNITSGLTGTVSNTLGGTGLL